MDAPFIEPEPDFTAFGFKLANDPDTGQILVNAEKADEFDPRVHNDVEGLLFLGYLTHDCEILGHKFTLKTLTRGERLAVTLFVKDYEETLGLADALETAYLAQSILLCDGRPLSIPLENEEPTVRLRRNFERVQRWFDPLLEALYVEYTHLLVRQKVALQELEGKLAASRATPTP